MCGIVGLFIKQPHLEAQLGSLLSGMLDTMRDRGPDSAGFAIYDPNTVGHTVKLTLRGPTGTDFAAIAAGVAGDIANPVQCTIRETHAVFNAASADETRLRRAINARAPEVRIVGVGARMEIYKEIGRPADVARRFGLGRCLARTA